MSSAKQAISDQHVAREENTAGVPTNDGIARLAYQLWEYRTRDDVAGSPEQDWLEAERQLQNTENQAEV
jgi:hypothetical protein